MLPPYLPPDTLHDFIARALAEDVGSGDVTTQAIIPPDRTAEARFLAKEEGVVAGLYVAEQVMRQTHPGLQTTWTVKDGTRVSKGTIFGTVAGPAGALLTGERLALNLLQRMSGIATATRRMVEAARPHKAHILDTRKTAPGLRPFDKWAVRLGGGDNHRIGLYDMILIKDNHIAAAGGIPEALHTAQQYRATAGRNDLKIEVEARTLDEVHAVLDTGGAAFILLDNMVHLREDGQVDTTLLAEAVALIDGRIATEASGNVTLATVPAIAATGVDYISSGGLTHSVQALDISLKINLG